MKSEASKNLVHRGMPYDLKHSGKRFSIGDPHNQRRDDLYSISFIYSISWMQLGRARYDSNGVSGGVSLSF